MSFEIEHDGREDNFSVPQHRAALRDARLSWGARGLFAWLWDLPRGWFLQSAHLAQMAPEGKDAVRARLRELRAVGALRLEEVRGVGGRVAGTRWIVVSPSKWAIEAPLKPPEDNDSAESRVSRLSANPTVGKPSSKVLQGSKDLQKARSSKRDSVEFSASSRRQLKISRGGINIWTRQDVETAERLEGDHGLESIKRAVATCIECGIEPLPSAIQRMMISLRAAQTAESNVSSRRG